jgi:hypothetical protein
MIFCVEFYSEAIDLTELYRKWKQNYSLCPMKNLTASARKENGKQVCLTVL